MKNINPGSVRKKLGGGDGWVMKLNDLGRQKLELQNSWQQRKVDARLYSDIIYIFP